MSEADRHHNRLLRKASLLLVSTIFWCTSLWAHDGHRSITYQVTEAWQMESQPADERVAYLRLRIEDEQGRLVPARFTLTVDGESYVPSHLGSDGLRFVSIHTGKRNTFVATYARGSGDVLIPLPEGQSGQVTATRGFEYVATTAPFSIPSNGESRCVVVLRRWIDMQAKGWMATDAHVHYERIDPAHDSDWLTMLSADGLSHAHFLVLKGGNVPGIWATQHAYGAKGEASRDDQFIRAGEEYRDSAQGHINLFGLGRVIEPISTGGIGRSAPFHHPPLADVLEETRRRGGIGGPAHGGALARSSTAILDSVLGKVDFFEIANSHLYKTDVWYQLLNGGFIIPPVGGTDLPNFGYRDSWQPLFGEIRTYVHMGQERGFDAWVKAVQRGEVFVTSGPLIHLNVNGVGPGGVIRLPAGGGELDVRAELRSPRQLHSLEIVQMGHPVRDQFIESTRNEITTLRLESKLPVTESCWIAARGLGGPKTAIEQGLGIEQSEIAHSGVIRVLVGDDPIGGASDVEVLRRHLIQQQQYYRSEGRFESAEQRNHMMNLFEQAIRNLDR